MNFGKRVGGLHTITFAPSFGARKMLTTPRVGMEDVADDRYFFSTDIAEFLTDRESIQQRLRGVFVSSVACIHDVRLDVACQKMRGTDAGMSHHDHVDLHRQDVVDGVEQRFAFFYRTVAGSEVDDIGRKAFLRQFERQSCAGRILEEHIRDRDIAQRWHFLDGSVDHIFEEVGRFKNEFDVLAGDVFDSQQMFLAQF